VSVDRFAMLSVICLWVRVLNRGKTGLVSIYLERSGSFDLLSFGLIGQARQKVFCSGDKRYKCLPLRDLSQHHNINKEHQIINHTAGN